MLKNLLKKEEGFTLIEIVLVLAIAGLILLIVFLAVQGAQKSQRDQRRKTDAGRVGGLLEQYAANNAGTYPTNAQFASTFVPQYLASSGLKDPSSGAAYTYTAGNTVTPCPVGTMYYRYVSIHSYQLDTCLEQGGYHRTTVQ